MSGLYYDRQGQPPHDVFEWGRLMEDKEYKIVQQDCTPYGDDEIMVSTVWLGLDHSFGLGGPPLIFETMVFGGPLDEEQHRYATEEEARLGHSGVMEMLTFTVMVERKEDA